MNHGVSIYKKKNKENKSLKMSGTGWPINYQVPKLLRLKEQISK